MGYKFEPHGPWVPLRGVGKSYCRKCGLVNLRNSFTQWSIGKGCNHDEHPDYQNQRNKAGGLK